jgi:hypothetical protein
MVAAVEAETQDEIDQIMSEIEELQQEMNAATQASSTPVAPEVLPPSATSTVPSPPPGSAAPSEEAQLMLNPEAELGVSDQSSLDAVEKDILKEFEGDGEEPWLEETMANLKTAPEKVDQDLPPENHEAEVQGIEDLGPDQFSQEMSVEEEVQQMIESEDLSEDGSLAMSVSGKLSLKLNHPKSGQSLLIQFGADSVLVRLSNGVEFKAPFQRKTSRGK